ncbi:MAG: hypothetical protein IJY65_05710 [Clostridia bacterium]|nr:hypothetical protein [Clostridia bacterium]
MKKIICLILCLAMCLSTALALTSCGETKADALVIMTENLDGLFNPFFSTSATDSTIVAMTQIGMLSSKYVNGNAEVAYGEDEAVVTKDFAFETNTEGTETVYTFVIKNGIKFSDGHPLTIEDVLFNLYVYLDPVYTGSATIYSTDIVGMNDYRTQQEGTTNDDQFEMNAELASSRAIARINELVTLFMTEGANYGSGGNVTYSLTYEKMCEAIRNHTLSSDYKNALAVPSKQGDITTTQLQKDYDYALEKFKKELESDFAAAKDSYVDEPYKSHSEFGDEVFCFMFAEGYVEVEYEKLAGTNKDDKSKIKKLTKLYTDAAVRDKASAIDFVYNDKISTELHIVLSAWATAQELQTEYAAKAKEVILHEQLEDGELLVDSISGIVSLGHNTTTESVTVNGTTYKVAKEHNEDGTPKNADEYDVLQITINGIDPKAHWNFAFTVAPQHYYGEGANTKVDIANNKFGVDYGSFDFMKNVVQSTRNIKLPMGAGAYKATDRANSDTPSQNDFYSNNVVYFKANTNFETVGSGLNNAHIEKVRYQVVSANNAIAALKDGTVHYITPQLTDDNFSKIEELKNSGVEYLLTDQLGYGYIGINASRVPDVNIRRAIMCAMNTTEAVKYYRPGTASQIYWPMSKVSWAYPLGADGQPSVDNGGDYPQMNGTWNVELAKQNIEKYMTAAGVSAGDPSLEYTFTIAGSNLQDHPTYITFRDAAALLNEMGWDITVEPDTQALTKINTGSLDVWAAAWGSTIDPDMYQIYHKNSTATSTNAWGYASIKNSGSQEEKDLLDELSDLIDQARETNDKATRTELYEQAMTKVLSLGIELPVYQRSTLYAYNSKVIDSSSLPSQNEMNPYTSPLDRIWELKFAE